LNPIRHFRDFISEGIVKKQAPDRSRAEYLVNESIRSHRFVSRLIKNEGVSDDNANSYVKLCYDIVMEIIRAKMLSGGYNASGQGAHEAEVAFLREIGVSETDVQFADQMRYFRNGITYYGKIMDSEYAKKVVEFMDRVYPVLKGLVET
jgi:hypothetical protein